MLTARVRIRAVVELAVVRRLLKCRTHAFALGGCLYRIPGRAAMYCFVSVLKGVCSISLVAWPNGDV
jgi:hypothetical protein